MFSGHTWIDLGWDAGFDGGYQQNFIIRLTKPDGETMEINTNETYSRWPRHAYFDRPDPESRNITDLKPLQTYTFAVQAWNRLGQTNFTEPASIQTEDAPLDSSLQQPYEVLFNPSSAGLRFKPTLDSGMYCLQVFLIKLQF